LDPDQRSSATLRALFGSTRSELTCAQPAQCGITPATPLLEAAQMHTDLSIPALHLQLFPFMQPVIDAVKNAPCNLTLIAPASANVLRAFKMAYKRYCASGSEWAGTDACTNTRKIIELDQVAVDNARKLADMNMQGQ